MDSIPSTTKSYKHGAYKQLKLLTAMIEAALTSEIVAGTNNDMISKF